MAEVRESQTSEMEETTADNDKAPLVNVDSDKPHEWRGVNNVHPSPILPSPREVVCDTPTDTRARTPTNDEVR